MKSTGITSYGEQDYSSVQGQANWYYQQWDGSNYTNLTYKNGQWEGQTPFTIIYKNFQHPDQTDSVRKWVAPRSGMIRITGNVAKNNPGGGGDGVVASILKNKTKLWIKSIAYNDTAGYDVELTVGVRSGDAIYFIVNKNKESTYDGTVWNPAIDFIESYSAEEEFSSVQGQNNWYYQQWDGSNYTDLTYMNGQWVGRTPTTIVTKDFQHPDETDSVRKWVAPKSGMIRIAGNVGKENPGGGDGVIATIVKNKIKLWTKTITYNDMVGYEVGLTVGVSAGDAIYFIINKNGDGAYDGTKWTPVIAYMGSHSAEEEYSDIQGQNNWYYQQWDGSNYTDLTYMNGQWEGRTPTTIVTKDFQHSDQTDSVRKWVAPKSGIIRIAGNVAKENPGGGDGVIASIAKNKVKLWTQTIAYNDMAGYEIGLTVGVSAGDAIYFTLNKNGDGAYDGTKWTPVIAYMGSHSAEEEYSDIQGQNNWYYQQWDGSNYTDLTYKNGQWEGRTPTTIVTKDFQHPDETDSVRKWVAPKSGMIRIAGNVAKENPGGGDGVIASIAKNKVKLWTQTIAYNDMAGYEIGLTVGVSAGDAIYFTLNKNGNGAYDGTKWTPAIAYID
ncbi:hypothetical protein VK70_07240 [Paenibacillus durus ATCC 35681]|uniref:Uncharacterized protein n=2 Tax=Paenibacillus durus TaxID=44251 RepID=A0A0F7F941_PAEDU|nr:hypothetical protein VK70_07240 [Paenibacillus durus ATCC 35681]